MAVLLDEGDDVAIARQMLIPGTVLITTRGSVTVRQTVPSGHKLALRALACGEPVRRYGQAIGITRSDVAAGDHVHVYNLAVGGRWPELDRTGGTANDCRTVLSEAERRRGGAGIGQLLVLGSAADR